MKGAIAFSDTMALALRDGRKVMTRRLAWRPPAMTGGERKPTQWQRLVVGELLWVREPFRGAESYERMKLPPSQWGNKPVWYPADGEPPGPAWGFLSNRDRLPRHMPRVLSRTTVRVISVRMEPLQEISAEDAIAEGIQSAPGGWWSGAPGQASPSATGAFAVLWDSLHGSGAWEANPEVVVIGLEVALNNIDALNITEGGTMPCKSC